MTTPLLVDKKINTNDVHQKIGFSNFLAILCIKKLIQNIFFHIFLFIEEIFNLILQNRGKSFPFLLKKLNPSHTESLTFYLGIFKNIKVE